MFFVRTALERRLAASHEVTTETVLDYLALVEERIDNLLLVRQYIASIDPDAPYIAKPILIGGNLIPLNTVQPNIIPPNLQADYDEGIIIIYILSKCSLGMCYQHFSSSGECGRLPR